MKVLMVNKFLYPAGGAETYIFKLGAYLSRHGCEVEYFGMNRPDNVAGNRWGLYTERVDFHKKGLLSNAANPLKLIYSTEAREKLGRLLALYEPDVVHINNFNYQLTPSIILAVEAYRRQSGRRTRLVYTAHDSQLVCPNHYLYHPDTHQVCERCLTDGYMHCVRNRCIHGSLARSCVGAMEAVYWKQKKVYGLLDVIICPSSFMKDRLDTNPLLAGKTVVIRNFVRPVRAEASRKGSYVLYFGRYSEEKGIRTLLEACRELPDIPFVFAGSGPLEALVAGTRTVRNMGFLKDEALDEVIRNARFSVCPSVCHENCPFSVIESLMLGTPVLGSRRGGIPELIEAGHTGWLYDGGGTELRDSIRRIWDSEEPEQFGRACEHVRFDTIETYGEQMMRLYQTC